jgi:ribonuclease HI
MISTNTHTIKNRVTNTDIHKDVEQNIYKISNKHTSVNHHTNINASMVTIDHFLGKRNTHENMNTCEHKNNYEHINVYCDGSAINNGKKNASGGIGVYFGVNSPHNISEPFLLEKPTNQKTELYAMIRTMQILEKIMSYNKHIKYDIHIYTDSEYVINCIKKWIPKWVKNNWFKYDGKCVKNVDFLKTLYELYCRNKHSYKISHVESHTSKRGHQYEGNMHADRLAVNGSHQHPNYKSMSTL